MFQNMNRKLSLIVVWGPESFTEALFDSDLVRKHQQKVLSRVTCGSTLHMCEKYKHTYTQTHMRGSSGYMDGWMAGWLDGWMVGWLAGWLDGWMDGLVDVCMSVEVCVCVCLHILCIYTYA